jgi:basic membrane lipoprotein Med (substrate-binding protein (PBP1-ABC) superfamily)/DNA-binding SARP family transcriptional activator
MMMDSNERGHMEFHALGTLAVTEGGDVVDVGPRKQQLLLALLLVHANEVVSTDRLLEHLWGDEADGKENAFWVYISRLRTALEPDRVERGASTILLRRDPGYVLAIDEDDFDVTQFERLVQSARDRISTDPSLAAADLARALDMWRGPALDGFADEPLLQGEAARLNEMRVNATEDRIDADLALGRAGELVSELESLHQHHPFRERPIGQLMLALYRTGRPAHALRSFERFRRMIGEELGIDPSPDLRRLEEQILLHDERLQRVPTVGDPGVATTGHTANPFKGLHPFLEADAGNFFGRDALVAEMVRAIGGGQRLTALVGASGSGKSSVVRAGLIPALTKGAVEGSDDWLFAYMVPGGHPFAEAEAALLRTGINTPNSLDEQLRDGDEGLLRAALRVLPSPEARLLLVIDQFEELFTLVDDPAVRERFLSNLVTVLDEPHGRVSIVLTLRADFYGRPLEHPEFGARMSGSVINVTPMTSEELRTAAIEPARRAGVSLEPALLGDLTHDVGTQPGALPLFQYALTELFDGRAESTMLASTYESMGGIHGALSRRASYLYDQLDAAERDAARQLFLRLVAVTESDEPSRRRVQAFEIVSLGIDTSVMQNVIGLFGEHRLLSFDADHPTSAPTVELAHEALLSAWPVLDAWIDESSDDLRRHASLAIAVREWQLADRHSDYLLPSSRLADYEEWASSSTMTLTEIERQFLDDGADKRDDERASQDLRHRDDTRSRRRLWGLVTTLAALLGVAALFLFGVFTADEGPTVAFFGIRDDGGWNENIAAGMERASQDVTIDLRYVSSVPDLTITFRELADTGPDFVISDGSPTFFAADVYDDFPDVRFGIVDGFYDSPNVDFVSFANEEGAFVVGAAAALKSESGVIGFIGGRQIPVIERFRAGFEAGVHFIDPEAEVLATFVARPGMPDHGGGFLNRELGRARATELYELGADVVFHAAGFSGLGLFDAVLAQSESTGEHLWAIGVDNDQWFDVTEPQQKHVLTSMIKRGDTAAYRLVERMLSGDNAEAGLEIGLADDGFAFSTQGDGLTDQMIDTLDQIQLDIANGRITVPSVPTGASF